LIFLKSIWLPFNHTHLSIIISIIIEACAIPYWGENCANKCVCTGRGARRCDPVKGCICKPGWQGDKCDNDINECLSTIDPKCDDPLKTCVNSLGSYTCSCRSGYQLTDEQKCEGMYNVSVLKEIHL
jgi:hypothetical protein